MKTLTAVVSVCLLSSLAVGAASPAHKGFAMMKRHLSLRDDAPGKLPYPAEKQVFACVDLSDEYYSVVCMDDQGLSRIAFLPSRDEWGRSTARAWKFDTSLASNTIAVVVPARLKQGRIPLVRGACYPIVREDKKSFTILYSFADFSRELTVPKTDAETLPPPKPITDPAKLREHKLEQVLDQAREDQEKLVAQLEKERGNVARIKELIKEISQTEIENRKVKSQLAQAETTYRELSAFKPPKQPALEPLQKELEKLIQEHGKLVRRVEKARLRSGPLKNLQKQVKDAETQLQKMKTNATHDQAELSALIKISTAEDLKQDKTLLVNMLDKADRQHANISRQLKQSEAAKTALSSVYAQLEEAKAQNGQLRETLNDLTLELAEIRKKIRALQNAE